MLSFISLEVLTSFQIRSSSISPPIELDDLPIIFPALKEYLQQQWKFTYIPELEADDLVSVYHDPLKTIICSPDKDVLYQNRVHNYNYGKGEFVEVDENDALRFLWKQVLMGDSTDGIMGIPKVGPKTAEGWLKDMPPSDLSLIHI